MGYFSRRLSPWEDASVFLCDFFRFFEKNVPICYLVVPGNILSFHRNGLLSHHFLVPVIFSASPTERSYDCATRIGPHGLVYKRVLITISRFRSHLLTNFRRSAFSRGRCARATRLPFIPLLAQYLQGVRTSQLSFSRNQLYGCFEREIDATLVDQFWRFFGSKSRFLEVEKLCFKTENNIVPELLSIGVRALPYRPIKHLNTNWKICERRYHDETWTNNWARMR